MSTGTTAGSIDHARLRQIKLWCRRHASQKSAIAKRVLPLRYAGLSHEQIRIQLGLTVEGYRRVKRWVADAVAESNTSTDYLSVEDALDRHCEQQVELVLRFAALKQQGASRQEIREHLKLTEEGLDRTDEWYRDSLAATEHDPDEGGI